MKKYLQAILFIAIVYILVSSIAFSFRNPYMTSTERLFYIPEMLTWKSVSYQELENWRRIR